MFKLILLFILFIMFVINYYFAYFQTIPTFNHISHFNFYTYLQDKFENRNWSFTLPDYKTGKNDSSYLLDYTWGILKTDLKYLWPTSDKLDIYMPIFILHTWDTLQKSWDSLFTGLQWDKNFLWYDQYITWWNDFIDIWSSVKDWKSIKQTLYLWYFYTYCSMSQTWRIDAYYFDRYKDWNKIEKKSNQSPVPDSYVCEDWYKLWEYKKCLLLWVCNTYYACTCNSKWEYEVCKKNTDLITNPDNKNCQNDGACIDYYTWTINLNNTNCSLSGALWIDSKKKYFLIR